MATKSKNKRKGSQLNFLLRHSRELAIISILILALVVGALGYHATHRSSALSAAQLCTDDNFHGCWRDSNNSDSYDNPIVIANHCDARYSNCEAQELNQIQLGTFYDGAPTYKLQFRYHSQLCVGVNDDGYHMETRACDGGFGTVWAYTTGKHWINRGASQQKGRRVDAEALEHNGDRMYVDSPGLPGEDYVYSFYN